MPVNLLSKLQQRYASNADRGRWFRFDVCGMERRMFRHGNLLGDHEFGEGGNRDIQYHSGPICSDRYRSGHRKRNGNQQSVGNQLPDDLFGKLQQRNSSDSDGGGG